MLSARIRVVLVCITLAVLAACSAGPSFVAKKEPWRIKEEQACLSSGAVRDNAFVRTKSGLGGPSPCGAVHPFEMSAAAGGRVLIKPPALLRCPMIPQVDQWIVEVVEPAAREVYGVSVAEVLLIGSYSCRPINNAFGGNLSEHGHANALDISGFVLADGRRVSVKKGWRGDRQARAFLRAVHHGACAQFTTVLGPNYNRLHHNHFHVDLAYRGPDGTRTVCK
jgi:hypothetical protein